MRYTLRIFICCTLLGVFTSGIFFVSENPYSINKKQTTFGETRSIAELIFSTNRLELKEKIEVTILNSEIRNFVLKGISSFVWIFQENSNFFDYQFFNTEIFYGKEGEVFPKYRECSSYNFENIEIDTFEENKFIFLLMPLKQEVERHRIHNFQRNLSICDNQKNFDIFQNLFQNNNLIFLDIYDIFYSNKKRFYESGDTHWNDLGVKTVFSELIEITHNKTELKLQKVGTINENNLVLKRLGLISKTTSQDLYKIDLENNKIKKILIIHDSFFEEYYVSNKFLSQYYDPVQLHWSKFENMSKDDATNLLKEYEFIIFESSIDTFFESRILFFENK